MSRASAIVALSIALACLGSVPRAEAAPHYSDPALARYMQVAFAHWGGAVPSCEAEGDRVPVHAELFDDPDPAVAARAEHPGCTIYLDRDFWPARLNRLDCVVIVHEWGHLLGHAHSGDQGNVMHEQPLLGAPGCDRLAAQAAAARRRAVAARRRARAAKHRASARRKARGQRGARAQRRARAHRRARAQRRVARST